MAGISQSWSFYICKRVWGACSMPRKQYPKGLPGFR